jgi:plasmid stabilization system protein ParE
LKRAIEFHEAARDELREAARWYEARLEGLGEEFLEAVEAALERVACGELPGLAPQEQGRPETRRLLMQRFPYAIHFDMGEGSLFVWAVAHEKRRPGYWRRRAWPKKIGA